VCTRCLGITGGALSAVIAAWLGWPCAAPPVRLGWLVPVMMLPAVVDFHGQLMHRWESTNLRRLVSGGLFGLALGWSVAAVTWGSWQPAGALVGGLLGYFGWLAAGRRRVVRLMQHVRLYVDYYERCRAEDARRAAGAVGNQTWSQEED
jgi:uncharacterized membrane protein